MTEREREIRKRVKSLRELSQCDVPECSKCKEDEAFFADERFLLSELDVARERAERAEAALEKMTAPRRPDGTWNYDREACRQMALDYFASRFGASTGKGA